MQGRRIRRIRRRRRRRRCGKEYSGSGHNPRDIINQSKVSKTESLMRKGKKTITNWSTRSRIDVERGHGSSQCINLIKVQSYAAKQVTNREEERTHQQYPLHPYPSPYHQHVYPLAFSAMPSFLAINHV